MGLTQQEGKVVSLRLSGGHMSWSSYYQYYLREKDGQVLFDAQRWIDGDAANGYKHREITFGNAVAAQEDMNALRALCERYHLARRRETYQLPKPGSGPFVRDAPMRRLDVHWDNGARLDAGIDFGNLDELLAFFEALAVRIYETKPRPEGEIVSFHLFNGDHFVKTNYYRFHIREEEGGIRLDALYYLGVKKKKFEEVKLEGAELPPEDMAALRGLCARYELAARQIGYVWPRNAWHSPIDQAKYNWQLEAVWANGVRLDCEGSITRGSDMKEALKNFFIALGNTIKISKG